jgi:hypothetical protein
VKRSIRLLAIAMIGLAVLLSGCGQTKQEAEEPAILDVKIDVKSPIKLNKKTEIACIVTYGNEKVTDADEVKFEIWKHGSEQHEMIKAPHKGDGTYAIEKAFAEPGTYSIVAHVTARNMHNMPKQDVVVGAKNAQSAETHAMGGHNNGAQHRHQHAGVSMTLQKQAYVANQAGELVVEIAHDGQPLTQATVHFEVWKEQSEKHEFIDGQEQGKGTYRAPITFKESGVYFIKTHVEAKELHEHQVERVTVQ